MPSSFAAAPSVFAGIRNFYGAHPLHLLALLGCFALAGYAVLLTADDPMLPRMLLWFGGAIIAHDLVLFPVYAIADRSLTSVLRWSRPRRRPPVRALNHVRVPTLGAGLLLLLFFPGIIQQGQPTYLAATGQTQAPFLGRWLLITAALFFASAIVYTVRLSRARRTSKTGGHRQGLAERTGTNAVADSGARQAERTDPVRGSATPPPGRNSRTASSPTALLVIVGVLGGRYLLRFLLRRR